MEFKVGDLVEIAADINNFGLTAKQGQWIIIDKINSFVENVHVGHLLMSDTEIHFAKAWAKLVYRADA